MPVQYSREPANSTGSVCLVPAEHFGEVVSGDLPGYSPELLWHSVHERPPVQSLVDPRLSVDGHPCFACHYRKLFVSIHDCTEALPDAVKNQPCPVFLAEIREYDRLGLSDWWELCVRFLGCLAVRADIPAQKPCAVLPDPSLTITNRIIELATTTPAMFGR